MTFYYLVGFLLLAALQVPIQAQLVTDYYSPQQSQQQCAVTVGNTDALCADLMRSVPLGTPTEDCDCYTFCNDKLIQCGKFGESSPFQCVGTTVAGCRMEQVQDAEVVEEEDTTATTTATDKGDDDYFTAYIQQECAVTVNAEDQVCSKFMEKTASDSLCDCYNFCNGQLIGCLAFGEKVTFSCSGETVAGCLESQRTSGPSSSANKPQLSRTILVVTLCLTGMIALL